MQFYIDGSRNDMNGIMEYVNAKNQRCFYVACLTFHGLLRNGK